MNKTITAAYDAALANPTDADLVKALADLAVPKFKTVYGKVQSAVKTINKHIGPNKGTPNRAKMAEAIGMRNNGMIAEYTDIANLIGMPDMANAVITLTKVVDEIDAMRKTRTYTHMDFLPDFLTAEEKREKAVYGAKLYLLNIVNAVNRAVATINKHINNGDFGPNTFKIAKAIGYATEIPLVKAEFTALVTSEETFATELALCDLVETTINAIVNEKAVGNTALVPVIPMYTPFAYDDDGALYEDFEPSEEE